MPYGWLKTAEKEDFIHPRQECLVVLEQRSRARAFLWAVGGFDKGGVDIKSLDRSINKRSAWISFEISQYADYVIAELNLSNRSTVWDCGSLTEPLYPRLSQCVFLSALGPACWQWRDTVGGKKSLVKTQGGAVWFKTSTVSRGSHDGLSQRNNHVTQKKHDAKEQQFMLHLSSPSLIRFSSS